MNRLKICWTVSLRTNKMDTNELMDKEDAELIINALACLWDEHYGYPWYKYEDHRKQTAEHIKRLATELRKEFNIEKDKWADF